MTKRFGWTKDVLINNIGNRAYEKYAGKMQYYLSALDETVKLPDENPSIGIIICKNKKRTRVEYTLRKSNAPIGVATYSFQDNLPEDMRGLLPTPDEIAAIIGEINNTGTEE